MFIDRLLDNWRSISGQFWTVDQKHFYFAEGLWRSGDAIANLKNALKEAVCFDIDNVFDVYAEKLIKNGVSVSELPNCKMPYPIMWFEHKAYDKKYQSEVYRQAGVYNKRLATLWIENKEADNRFSALIFGFCIPEGSSAVALTGWWTIEYSKDGQLTSRINYPVMPGEKFINKDDFWRNTLTWFLLMPLASISFMHCKNVTIHSEEPPIKLQKARERRGKLPLFTFKTLEIKSMARVLREEGESETKGLRYALHICRGHFKDFREGPGLGRGHTHGLWWWDSQVRGNKEIGAVIKDYRVSPNM